MKKSKIQTVTMIMSLLLFVVAIGLNISMGSIDKQTEDTTTFYTATVIGVDVTDAGENSFADIQTKEYNTALHISTNISKNMGMDEVRNLSNGQKIWFGIENTKAQQMNKVEFVTITALKTDTKEILSLEQYNQYIHDSAHPARIASVVMACFFLVISVFCYWNIRKNGSRRFA